MKLLISFVNQVFTPELKLAVYCTESEELTWVGGRAAEIGEGATGLASNKKNRIYACIQNNGIMVYDFSLELIQYYEFVKVKDVHSTCMSDGKLYVVSSGTNEVYCLRLDEQGKIVDEELFWKVQGLSSYDIDFVHLNSITKFKGDFVVSMFGERTLAQNWKDVNEGVLYKLQDETILDSLKHPHTAYNLNGKLLVCESKAGKLLDSDGNCLLKLDGYIRGVTHSENNIFVAASSRRKLSKSRKKIIDGRVGGFENNSSKSKIYVINIVTNEVEYEIDMSLYGNEVYDLLVMPASFSGGFENELSALESRIYSFEDNLSRLIVSFERENNSLIENCNEIKNEYQELRNKNKQLNESYDSLNYKIEHYEALYMLVQKLCSPAMKYNPFVKLKVYKEMVRKYWIITSKIK